MKQHGAKLRETPEAEPAPAPRNSFDRQYCPGETGELVAQPIVREVFDTPGAAEYLGVSRQLLELLRVRGDGPRYVKLSRRLVRYRRESLEAWLVAAERSSTSQRGRT